MFGVPAGQLLELDEGKVGHSNLDAYQLEVHLLLWGCALSCIEGELVNLLCDEVVKFFRAVLLVELKGAQLDQLFKDELLRLFHCFCEDWIGKALRTRQRRLDVAGEKFCPELALDRVRLTLDFGLFLFKSLLNRIL